MGHSPCLKYEQLSSTKIKTEDCFELTVWLWSDKKVQDDDGDLEEWAMTGLIWRGPGWKVRKKDIPDCNCTVYSVLDNSLEK